MSTTDIIKQRWISILDQGATGISAWLRRMYYSEIGATAAVAAQLADPGKMPLEFFDGLHRIVLDETRHALMVAKVMRLRGTWPPTPKSRKGTVSPLDSEFSTVPFDYAQTAWVDLQAEAEAVRRLNAIWDNEQSPSDIAALAQALLKDENEHVKFFTAWAHRPPEEYVATYKRFATYSWGHDEMASTAQDTK